MCKDCPLKEHHFDFLSERSANLYKVFEAFRFQQSSETSDMPDVPRMERRALMHAFSRPCTQRRLPEIAPVSKRTAMLAAITG